MRPRPKLLLAGFALATLGACGTLRPEDAAIIAPLAPDAAIAALFPGAANVCPGLDLAGERALRDGDRVLFGIEVVHGDSVHRHLLEVIAHRRRLGTDIGTARFVPGEGDTTSPHIPERMTRLLDLELVLRSPDGAEVQRSRIEEAMELVFDESFVSGIVGSQHGDPRLEMVARLRLGEIATLLQKDPILHHLLAEVASIPWDFRLLFRRVVTMAAYFDQGRPVEGSGDAQAAAGARCELPFDLFLNDSLLVRLAATVVDPQGPTGAIAGITALRAQDAAHPDNQIRMHLLGAARGPQSEWLADGALATCGYQDEGLGLAFSPDGRFVAMPGSGGTVEVRDLTLADPSVPAVVDGRVAARDLAFLDATTLLVAHATGVTVVDATVATPGAHLPVRAELAAPASAGGGVVSAIELTGNGTCFVGTDSGRIERWTFAVDRAAAPQCEVVRGDVWGMDTEAVVKIEGQGPQKVRARLSPLDGWLVAEAPDRLLARSGKGETELLRAADGTWTARELPASQRGHWRRQRQGRDREAMAFARLGKGVRLVRAESTGLHAWAGGYLSLTSANGTRLFGQVGDDGREFAHGFSPNGRYYAFVGRGYRLLVDGERFLRGQ